MKKLEISAQKSLKVLRQWMWKTAHVVVGFVTIVNVTLVGSLAPQIARAAQPAADLDQCRNGSAASHQDCIDGTWVNGNAGSSNSHYTEGESIAYRSVLTDLPTATSITITYGYDIKHSDKHAVDYLTQYDRTDVNVDPIHDIAAASGSPSTFAFPAPSSAGSPVAGQPTTSFNALPADERVMSIWNGTITNIVYNTQGNLTDAQAETTIDVTFTASDPTVVMSWGGHIGSRLDWGFDAGVPRSAGGISGSPYHMRLIGWSLSNLGQQDRSLSADAVIPPANITIVKQTLPDGSTEEFSFDSSEAALDGTLSDGGTIVASLAPGQYSVTETDANTNGWTLNSIVCSDTDSTGNTATGVLTLNVTSSEAVTCTFTNAQTPKLTVTKIVNNDNGGTAEIGDFDLFVDASQVVSGATNTFAPDTYVVSEANGPTGYTGAIAGDCDAQGNVTLLYGDDKACTITNTDDMPSLTLVKEVMNDDGGAYNPEDWTLTAAGPTGISGTTPVTSGPSFDAGTYTLSEVGPNGYTAGTWVCLGDGTQNGDQITLALGESATCTIINDDDPATLIVRKVVVNDNGGTATADQFAFEIDGGNTTWFEADGENSVTVPAGTYDITEPAVAGYSTTYDNCENVQVGNGESEICTITNNDIAPKLTVTKVVSGGTAEVADFDLFVGQTPVTSGVQNNFSAGSYVVSETNLAGYTGVISGDCNAQGNVTLGLADVKSCTITNTRDQGTIELKKVWEVQPGTTTLAIGTTIGGNQVDSQVVNGNGTTGPNTVDTGTYYLSETGGLENYNSGLACTDGETSFEGGPNNSVTVQNGQSIVCTFTNTRQTSTITVLKNVDTDGDGDVDIVGANDWTWDIQGGEQNIATGQSRTLVTGSYTINEDMQAGYHFTSVTCSVNQDPFEVSQGTSVSFQTFSNGDYVCTFTNTKNVTTIGIDKTGPATATPGSQYSYTLAWSVAGNTPATNAVVTDPIPANTTFVSQNCGTTAGTCTPSFANNMATWELGTRNPGESGTVTLTVQVNPGIVTSTTLTNIGTFSVDQTEPVNDTVETRVSIVLGEETAPDLALVKSVNTTTAKPGDVLTYTIRVTSTGTEDAVDVAVSDVLPPGLSFLDQTSKVMTWDLGTLPMGETRTLTVLVRVNADTTSGDHVNIASATADGVAQVQDDATVNVRVPQVLGLATTGIGPIDYLLFLVGLMLATFGVVSLRKRSTSKV